MSIALAALTALTTFTAQAQQRGVAEKAGGRLDDAGAAVKRGVGKASDAVKGQYDRAKESVHAMSVESRVYGRIHWDKTLTAATIDVSVNKDGVATLTGTVPTRADKATAVELTNQTVGVTRVVDQLTLTLMNPPRTR